MHKMEDKISGFITRHCGKLALACILSAALPAYLLRNVHIDNAAEVWLSTRNPARQDYADFLAKYGNEEFVAIAGTAEDPLSADCLALQKDLAGRLRRIGRTSFAETRSSATSCSVRMDIRSAWLSISRRSKARPRGKPL
jgi:predicted RND superfamily exporter protein